MTIEKCLAKVTFSHFLIRLTAIFEGKKETVKLTSDNHLRLLENARKYLDEQKGVEPEIKLYAVFSNGRPDEEIPEEEWFNPI